MKLEDIFNKVKSILEDDAVLGAYIKKVFAGTRENIPVNNFPCIILEPAKAPELPVTLPHQMEIGFKITIYAYIKIYDVDKQIVGDDSTKGILDVNFDIKKALGAYIDLDGKCINFEFLDTSFSFEDYPFRGVEMDMEIILRQDFKTRA